jgi:diketogulonate reductase-like aldo/keto reductase
MMRTVRLPSGVEVSAIGQGTWYMGDRSSEASREISSLQLGIDMGMTLIDTAEMYAEGGAERIVAQATVGRRDQVFIVSKVYPHNASRTGTPAACERSLRRLNTDRIDLYLLHWRGGHPLAETVAAFEKLREQGKIRHWGVSNLDVSDMEELNKAQGGGNCAANQVLYHPNSRGIEYDLVPWCEQRGVAIMAYSPLGHTTSRLLRSPALQSIAKRHGVTPAQVALAWGLRFPHVISIPKASDPTHVRENAAAIDVTLIADDLAEIDAAHEPPGRKRPLDLL